MTIQVSKSYQDLPRGTIPEALISTLSLALSDRSILTPYNVNEFTETLTQQLSLKDSSNVQLDDEYIYFAFTVLLELVMKGHATFDRSQTNYIVVEWFLANPSFKAWLCSQEFVQDIKNDIYRFLLELSGKTTLQHMQTHLQNGLRETVVEPMLYYLYEDKERVLKEISKATYSKVLSKKKELFEAASEMQRTVQKISESSREEAIDLGLDLTQSLVEKTKQYTPISPTKVGVFFQLFTSPKPGELINVLSIHGLVETSLVSLIYARPNVKDLTVRTIAAVTGSYTGNTALCAIVAHAYLTGKRKDFIPSEADRVLIKLFKTVQREIKTNIEKVHDVLSEGMQEKGVPPLVQKYVFNLPQFISACLLTELFYNEASHMKTAMYTPYVLEHFGNLLSKQWGVCGQNTFVFHNKLDAIILQAVIGTMTQIILKNSNIQMVPALLTTPFMLDQMQNSKMYRSFVRRILTMPEEAQFLVKNLKRMKKVFTLTVDLLKGVSPSVVTWGGRATMAVTTGSIGVGAYAHRHHLEKLRKGAVSVVREGAGLYGTYYRIQLAAHVIGATMAPAIELIVDPSNLGKLTGVCAAATMQYVSEEDRPLASALVAKSVEMICNRLRIFEYRNMQDRVSRGWAQAKENSKRAVDRLFGAGNQVYQRASS